MPPGGAKLYTHLWLPGSLILVASITLNISDRT
jgi:hypothetical protein